MLAAVDGAVYGLDAASGKVLWRRFVGFDANPQAAVLPADAAFRRAGQRRAGGRYRPQRAPAARRRHRPRPLAARRRRAVRRLPGRRRRKYPGRHPQRQVDHYRRRLGRVAGLRAVSAAASRRPGGRFPPIAGLPGGRPHQYLHPLAGRRRLQARRLPGAPAGKHHHRAGGDRGFPAGGRQRRRPRLRVAGAGDSAEAVGQARTVAEAGAADPPGRARLRRRRWSTGGECW